MSSPRIIWRRVDQFDSNKDRSEKPGTTPHDAIPRILGDGRLKVCSPPEGSVPAKAAYDRAAGGYDKNPSLAFDERHLKNNIISLLTRALEGPKSGSPPTPTHVCVQESRDEKGGWAPERSASTPNLTSTRLGETYIPKTVLDVANWTIGLRNNKYEIYFVVFIVLHSHKKLFINTTSNFTKK